MAFVEFMKKALQRGRSVTLPAGESLEHSIFISNCSSFRSQRSFVCPPSIRSTEPTKVSKSISNTRRCTLYKLLVYKPTSCTS